VPLAAHQLFGLDQKAVALGLLFARVRDRISLGNFFAPVFREAPDEQAAALVWIILLAVAMHLVQLRVRQ
jgi:hypothetical protein